MAALNFAELSKPLPGENPCGPDLEDDNDFMNVTARLEVALPSAYFRRDDEGRQVAFDRGSIDFVSAFADLARLMTQSRDLRLFALAAKFSILNRDLAGFSDCLSAMAALLETHWEAMHPRGPDGDVVMREVALQGLDELATVVLPMQHTPLFISRRIGPFSFRSQLVASGETPLVEGEQHPDAGSIQAALADVDIDDLTATLGRVQAARDALARLCATWLEKVGVDHPLGFPRLVALLDRIAGFLDAAVARRVPGNQGAGAAPEAAGRDAQVLTSGPPSFDPAGLSSILQVKDTLAGCLGYFRRTEPSSPAVLLIGQAQQLIGKSLIEVLQIMFPEHIDSAVMKIGDRRRFRLPLGRLPAPEDPAYPEDGVEPVELSGDEPDTGPGEASPGSTAAYGPVIGSRADAVAAMKAVAAFYRRVEPSHPTPLLLDKACAFAQHDFMSLLGNILPDVVPLPEEDS